MKSTENETDFMTLLFQHEEIRAEWTLLVAREFKTPYFCDIAYLHIGLLQLGL